MAAKLAFIAGKTFTYQDLKFYAMNGQICLHDETDGDFRVLTCDEFKARAAAINEEARQLKSSSKRSDYERRLQLFRVTADMGECIEEAKHQGDHNDPIVSAWFRRHRPWTRSSASMTGAANFATAAPGPLPRGKRSAPLVRPDSVKSVGSKQQRKLILI